MDGSFVNHINESKERFAKDIIKLREFEDEVDLWIRAEDCDLCKNEQLCSSHYEQFYGGYWRAIPDL